jgi:tRNA (guanine-N7-)-methyltransferase
MMSSPSLSLMDEQDGGGTRKRPAAAASGNVDEENDDHDDTDGAGSNNNKEWREKITLEGEAPQKKFYRQRAHANPLSHNDSFQYPVSPAHVNWRDYFEITSDADADADAADTSNTAAALAPTVLDIGCGFGGLTMRLCQLLPNERILGLEIRTKVTEYVRLRILHARQQQQPQRRQPILQQRDDHGPEKDEGDDDLYEKAGPDQDQDKSAAPFAFNAAVLRTNSMKYFPNYFCRASLHKIFICFPDPHFKRKNHPRRIVSKRLLDEYAYGLKISGRLYLITDVYELHLWHVHHADAHPLFRRLLVSSNTTTTATTGAAADAAATTLTNLIHEDDDPCIAAMRTVTEEGQKVERNQGDKYYAVYERIDEDKKFTSARDFFNQD